jgi:hypothetical protein
MNNSINRPTSCLGRRQFSLLKANKVKASISLLAQARTIPRTASTPARCPAIRGNCRCSAHRPLPSMIIAIWRGSCAGISTPSVVTVTSTNKKPYSLPPSPSPLPRGRDGVGESHPPPCEGGRKGWGLDFHKLFLLGRYKFINLGDIGTCKLLGLLFSAPPFIFGDLFVFHHGF